jgi:hypothetical protein
MRQHLSSSIQCQWLAFVLPFVLRKFCSLQTVQCRDAIIQRAQCSAATHAVVCTPTCRDAILWCSGAFGSRCKAIIAFAAGLGGVALAVGAKRAPAMDKTPASMQQQQHSSCRLTIVCKHT